MYRKALAINPKHAKAWGNLGIALASTGSLEESVEPFTKVRGGCVIVSPPVHMH